MNNININNIFNFKTSNENSELNIDTITPNKMSNKISNITDDIILNKIKYNNEFEKQKLFDLYELKYSECLSKINNAIDINITDIFFQLTSGYFGYKSYNSLNCLEYIQEKLRNKKFNTLIINNTNIFISWKNINN